MPDARSDSPPATLAVAVAVSGGRDSVALLHATARVAQALGLQVHALHLHHGLQPQADDWVIALRRRVQAWRRHGWPVHLHVRHLALRPGPGESVEAVARHARHAALAEMAADNGCDLLLLAHHRRDQAETVLLQALRGAGPAGLAAMPRQAWRDGVCWARPWLDQPREAVAHYLTRHRLRWSEDPSNADTRFARNRLRHEVWPLLAAAHPGLETALGTVARQAARAAACLDDLAAMDIARPGVLEGEDLCLRPWRALGEARALNVLRHWYQRGCGSVPSAQGAQRVWDEAGPSANARWEEGGHVLRAWRGRLSLHPLGARPPVATEPCGSEGGRAAAAARSDLPWSAVPSRPCSAGEPGIPARRRRGARWVRRQGGEQFQSGPGRPPRSLKKQFQAAGVPPWQRSDWLLVDAAGAVLYVPGLGVDARAADHHEAGRRVPRAAPDSGKAPGHG